MARGHIRIAEETGAKKAFAWAIDWPGWARSGKTPELAHAILIEYAPRYAEVAAVAQLEIPGVNEAILDVVDSVPGGSGTDFGVPSAITDADRRPVAAADAARLADLVAGAWTVFERVAAAAPGLLRKGPRGGGRDRDKMVGHVIEADHAYAREIGVRVPEPHFGDREAVHAERAAMLEVLRRPSDGGPLAERKWTQRYEIGRASCRERVEIWVGGGAM